MNPTTTTAGRAGLLLALAAGLTAGLAPTATTIRFAPEEGLSLTKTFATSTSAELDDMTFEMGGEELELPEIPEINIRSTETIVFEDTYDAVADGRPTQLTRAFSELDRSRNETFPGEGGELTDNDIEETSELTDTVVVFTWDEDDEEYTAAFDEDADGDEELLEGLWCDADVLGFLPDGEVEEGDTWEVDVEHYTIFFSPSGDLTFLDQDGNSSRDEIDEEIEESLDGEIECELESVEDGLAMISVTIEVEGSGDTEQELEGDGEMVDGGTATRAVEVESEYEGTLVWDLRAGHMVSFELVGESEVSISEGVTLDITTGDTFEQVQTMYFTSETEIEVTFE